VPHHVVTDSVNCFSKVDVGLSLSLYYNLRPTSIDAGLNLQGLGHEDVVKL